MALRSGFELSGWPELNKTFGDLPKATGKAALRTLGERRLEPMRAAADARAPRDTHLLEREIHISPKQRSSTAVRNKMTKPGQFALYMGPSTKAVVRGQMQEFGTYKEPAQPFMRPAWDAHADRVLDGISEDLWDIIRDRAERVARKAARRAAKGLG